MAKVGLLDVKIIPIDFVLESLDNTIKSILPENMKHSESDLLKFLIEIKYPSADLILKHKYQLGDTIGVTVTSDTINKAGFRSILNTENNPIYVNEPSNSVYKVIGNVLDQVDYIIALVPATDKNINFYFNSTFVKGVLTLPHTPDPLIDGTFTYELDMSTFCSVPIPVDGLVASDIDVYDNTDKDFYETTIAWSLKYNNNEHAIYDKIIGFNIYCESSFLGSILPLFVPYDSSGRYSQKYVIPGLLKKHMRDMFENTGITTEKLKFTVITIKSGLLNSERKSYSVTVNYMRTINITDIWIEGGTRTKAIKYRNDMTYTALNSSGTKLWDDKGDSYQELVLGWETSEKPFKQEVKAYTYFSSITAKLDILRLGVESDVSTEVQPQSGALVFKYSYPTYLNRTLFERNGDIKEASDYTGNVSHNTTRYVVFKVTVYDEEGHKYSRSSQVVKIERRPIIRNYMITDEEVPGGRQYYNYEYGFNFNLYPAATGEDLDNVDLSWGIDRVTLAQWLGLDLEKDNKSFGELIEMYTKNFFSNILTTYERFRNIISPVWFELYLVIKSDNYFDVNDNNELVLMTPIDEGYLNRKNGSGLIYGVDGTRDTEYEYLIDVFDKDFLDWLLSIDHQHKVTVDKDKFAFYENSNYINKVLSVIKESMIKYRNKDIDFSTITNIGDAQKLFRRMIDMGYMTFRLQQYEYLPSIYFQKYPVHWECPMCGHKFVTAQLDTTDSLYVFDGDNPSSYYKSAEITESTDVVPGSFNVLRSSRKGYACPECGYKPNDYEIDIVPDWLQKLTGLDIGLPNLFGTIDTEHGTRSNFDLYDYNNRLDKLLMGVFYSGKNATEISFKNFYQFMAGLFSGEFNGDSISKMLESSSITGATTDINTSGINNFKQLFQTTGSYIDEFRDYYKATCSKCGHELYLDILVFDGEHIICPYCLHDNVNDAISAVLDGEEHLTPKQIMQASMSVVHDTDFLNFYHKSGTLDLDIMAHYCPSGNISIISPNTNSEISTIFIKNSAGVSDNKYNIKWKYDNTYGKLTGFTICVGVSNLENDNWKTVVKSSNNGYGEYLYNPVEVTDNKDVRTYQFDFVIGNLGSYSGSNYTITKEDIGNSIVCDCNFNIDPTLFTTYVVTKDTNYNDSKTYYVLGNYDEYVPYNGYFESYDEQFQEDKTYYTLTNEEYVAYSGYFVTSDEEPVEGKIYYTENDGTYTVFEGEEFDPNTNYYEHGFKPSIVYYEHGFEPDVVYYEKSEISFPLRFAVEIRPFYKINDQKLYGKSRTYLKHDASNWDGCYTDYSKVSYTSAYANISEVILLTRGNLNMVYPNPYSSNIYNLTPELDSTIMYDEDTGELINSYTGTYHWMGKKNPTFITKLYFDFNSGLNYKLTDLKLLSGTDTDDTDNPTLVGKELKNSSSTYDFKYALIKKYIASDVTPFSTTTEYNSGDIASFTGEVFRCSTDGKPVSYESEEDIFNNFSEYWDDERDFVLQLVDLGGPSSPDGICGMYFVHDDYELTEDQTYDSSKTYYVLDNNEYREFNPEVDIFDPDTIYELIEGNIYCRPIAMEDEKLAFAFPITEETYKYNSIKVSNDYEVIEISAETEPEDGIIKRHCKAGECYYLKESGGGMSFGYLIKLIGSRLPALDAMRDPEDAPFGIWHMTIPMAYHHISEFTGSSFIPNMIYYEASSDDDTTMYQVTKDITPQSGKTYYVMSKNYDDYKNGFSDLYLEEFMSGQGITAWEYEIVQYSGYYETHDIERDTTKNYYTYSSQQGYQLDLNSTFVSDITYYEQGFDLGTNYYQYVLTSDLSYDEDKIYYVLDNNKYVVYTGGSAGFDPSIIYELILVNANYDPLNTYYVLDMKLYTIMFPEENEIGVMDVSFGFKTANVYDITSKSTSQMFGGLIAQSYNTQLSDINNDKLICDNDSYEISDINDCINSLLNSSNLSIEEFKDIPTIGNSYYVTSDLSPDPNKTYYVYNSSTGQYDVSTDDPFVSGTTYYEIVSNSFSKSVSYQFDTVSGTPTYNKTFNATDADSNLFKVGNGDFFTSSSSIKSLLINVAGTKFGVTYNEEDGKLYIDSTAASINDSAIRALCDFMELLFLTNRNNIYDLVNTSNPFDPNETYYNLVDGEYVVSSDSSFVPGTDYYTKPYNYNTEIELITNSFNSDPSILEDLNVFNKHSIMELFYSKFNESYKIPIKNQEYVWNKLMTLDRGTYVTGAECEYNWFGVTADLSMGDMSMYNLTDSGNKLSLTLFIASQYFDLTMDNMEYSFMGFIPDLGSLFIGCLYNNKIEPSIDNEEINCNYYVKYKDNIGKYKVFKETEDAEPLTNKLYFYIYEDKYKMFSDSEFNPEITYYEFNSLPLTNVNLINSDTINWTRYNKDINFIPDNLYNIGDILATHKYSVTTDIELIPGVTYYTEEYDSSTHNRIYVEYPGYYLTHDEEYNSSKIYYKLIDGEYVQYDPSDPFVPSELYEVGFDLRNYGKYYIYSNEIDPRVITCINGTKYYTYSDLRNPSYWKELTGTYVAPDSQGNYNIQLSGDYYIITKINESGTHVVNSDEINNMRLRLKYQYEYAGNTVIMDPIFTDKYVDDNDNVIDRPKLKLEFINRRSQSSITDKTIYSDIYQVTKYCPRCHRLYRPLNVGESSDYYYHYKFKTSLIDDTSTEDDNSINPIVYSKYDMVNRDTIKPFDKYENYDYNINVDREINSSFKGYCIECTNVNIDDIEHGDGSYFTINISKASDYFINVESMEIHVNDLIYYYDIVKNVFFSADYFVTNDKLAQEGKTYFSYDSELDRYVMYFGENVEGKYENDVVQIVNSSIFYPSFNIKFSRDFKSTDVIKVKYGYYNVSLEDINNSYIEDTIGTNDNGAYWAVRNSEIFNGFYSNHTPMYTIMGRNKEITSDEYKYLINNSITSARDINKYFDDTDPDFANIMFGIPTEVTLPDKDDIINGSNFTSTTLREDMDVIIGEN